MGGSHGGKRMCGDRLRASRAARERCGALLELPTSATVGGSPGLGSIVIGHMLAHSGWPRQLRRMLLLFPACGRLFAHGLHLRCKSATCGHRPIASCTSPAVHAQVPNPATCRAHLHTPPWYVPSTGTNRTFTRICVRACTPVSRSWTRPAPACAHVHYPTTIHWGVQAHKCWHTQRPSPNRVWQVAQGVWGFGDSWRCVPLTICV